MPTHIAAQGDSIPSIAASNGFLWKTIADDPQNAGLMTDRDPNILFGGDEIFVPEREEKWVDVATEETHEFTRLGDPVMFKLQLRRLGEPRKDEDYTLQIGTEIIEGKTDGDGKLETFVPANAKSATLLLNQGKEKYTLRLSRLDPVEEVSGVKQRLNNLGYACGREDDELTPKTKAALAKFQAANDLDPTGEPDGPTRDKLLSLHP